MAELPENIKGYECKHAMYRRSAANPRNDLVMVKENIHYKDGRIEPNLRMIYNYERELWVTKPGFQNHTDKKEWEKIDRVQRFKTTQAELPKAIARALGTPGKMGSVRQLARSQYLYGCDVTTPVLIKQKYMKMFPNLVSDNRVAVLDTETNVLGGPEDIIMGSLTMKEKAFVVVRESYLGDMVDVERRLNEKFDYYLGDIAKKRNIKLELKIVKTAGDVAYELIQKAHQWKPDIVSMWNIDFDMTKMIEGLEKAGYDVGDVFSDPIIPKEYRTARYVRGQAQRVTANGKVLSLHMAERWNTMDCLSSFYFFCAMATYKKLRVAKGNEASYALDYILNKHLGIRKLKFKEADHLHGLRWHQFMQKEYKLEYIVYNIFDCISVEMLDEKTGDLARAVSSLCGVSEYAKFPSQPRRLVDNLHFECLEKGYVIGTTSDNMVEELDKDIIGVDNWIVTLPSHMVADNGICLIKDLPKLRSSCRIHVADLDCVSTYPTTGEVMNLGRETTWRELSRFRGIDEDRQRLISINFTGGPVNAMEIAREVYQFPSHQTLLNSFQEHLNKVA